MAIVSIRKMNNEDWNAVREIYLEGIASGNATFQMTPPVWQEWDSAHLRECRYVACIENSVVGWVALAPYSRRDAYRGVAELSIYVGSGYQGFGVGKSLLSELVTGSENAGFWTLLAGIFPENERSIALHLGQGFREVGYREKVGEMHGVWRDVLIFERRSRAVCY